MKLKRPYTTYTPALRGFCESWNTNPEGAYQGAKDELQSILSGGKAVDLERMVFLAGLSFEYQLTKGKGVHVFIRDSAFCNWLVGCAPKLEPYHANAIGVFERLAGDPEHPIVMHFPTDSASKSFLFGVVSAAASLGEKGLHICRGKVPLGDAFCFSFPLISGLKIDQRVEWESRLIAGLGMYLSCFPETLVDGLPQDLKHPSHHQYKVAKIVGVSPKVCLGGTHASPISHPRRSHMRVLHSEKFTHKRYQSVHVKETFVGGKAKTALSPEEAAA